jgi:hypothetical protein
MVLVPIKPIRPNVCVEAGCALEDHKQNRLLFLFQPWKGAKEVPFDLSTFRYEPITQTAEIPEKIKPHIQEIVKTASGT